MLLGRNDCPAPDEASIVYDDPCRRACRHACRGLHFRRLCRYVDLHAPRFAAPGSTAWETEA